MLNSIQESGTERYVVYVVGELETIFVQKEKDYAQETDTVRNLATHVAIEENKSVIQKLVAARATFFPTYRIVVKRGGKDV